MRTVAFLLVSLALAGCETPVHALAEFNAPVCSGYGQAMQCEAWARQFNAKLKQAGVESRLVGYEWALHGEVVRHLGVFWKDTDGWWYRDNVSPPRQVDSFGQYSWQERVANTLPEPSAIKIQHVWLDP